MTDMVKDYVDGVLAHVSVDEHTMRRLAEDLEAHIRDCAQEYGEREAIRRMGAPRELAQSLMDALYDDKQQVVRELLRAHRQLNQLRDYEYKSRATLWGMPLVHVCFSRTGRVRVAKGIIAIGNVAKGVVAIGGVSMGVVSLGGCALGAISLGGLALGLVSFGGLALALLLGIGGCATGAFAMGGFALGWFTYGGISVARYVAVGGEAYGAVAFGQQGAHGSLYQMLLTETNVPTRQQMIDVIRQHLPEVWDWAVRLITWPFG